jgi:hypothetical protein
VGSLYFAVVDFTAPRGACEMMITVAITLDPRKDRRGLIPVELDTRLAAGAGDLNTKFLPYKWEYHLTMPEGLLKSETFPILRSRDIVNVSNFSSTENTPCRHSIWCARIIFHI